MSWEMVTLVLGLCCVFLGGVWLYIWRDEKRATRLESDALAKIGEIKDGHRALATALGMAEGRVTKLEAAMRIDGARIMQQAAKGSIPEFMR